MLKPFIKNNKTYKSKVIKICDDCGKMSIVDAYDARRQRKNKNRKTEKDLCRKCSQKYRILPKGKNHANFKHGISSQGYYRITVDGVRYQEHKYIYGQHIGRKLTKKERVHHIDFNKLNNKIENLYLCKSNSENIKLNICLEKCGLAFLNKYIWFDYSKKIYILTPIIKPQFKEPTVSLPSYAKKLHVKKIRGTPYVMYLRKRHDWKRYHIAVMESFLNRKLRKEEGIHHINGNTVDNSINNLCLVTNREHHKAHTSLLHCAVELLGRGLIVFSNGLYKIAEKRNK